MDQNCDLFFPLPKQKDADRGEIKVVLNIFKKTLSDLPFGNQEQAAKKIFDVLFKSNKIKFKEEERKELLEEIEEPAAQILSGLMVKIKDVSAPIGRSEERVAKILVAIHYELALAYRCLTDKQSTKGLLRSMDKRADADHIRHSIYHLGEILRAKYSVFTNPSGAIWRYIYTLFICAYNHQVHNISLPSSRWCSFNTVEEAFKSIILMSISSPLTMRGNEFNTLYELAPDLTGYIELGKINCGESYSGLMTFNLSGTEPPKKQFATGCDACGNASNCFTVNTAPLIEYLERQEEQIELNSKLNPIQRFLNAHGQLDNLKRNLTGLERSGDAKRIKGGGLLVELIAGFNDVCTFLSKDSAVTVDAEEDADANYDMDGWTTIGEEDITVEDTDAWTTTGIIRAGLRKTVCKVINQSRGGYCLYLDADEKFHLRVGELLIVKASGKSEWQAAVVAWVSGTKKRMDFGVKFLEGVVSSGTLRPIYSKDGGNDSDCLFLKIEYGDDDKSIRIITASQDFSNGERLLVNYKGNEYRVTVVNISVKTYGYVEYICDWSDIEEDVAEKAEDDTALGRNFESIWDEL